MAFYRNVIERDRVNVKKRHLQMSSVELLTCRISTFLGSTILTFLSLQDTTTLEPFQFHEALRGMSGKSISYTASPSPTFQTITLLSEPAKRRRPFVTLEVIFFSFIHHLLFCKQAYPSGHTDVCT